MLKRSKKFWAFVLIAVLSAALLAFLYQNWLVSQQVEAAEQEVRDHLERVSFDVDGEIWEVSVEDPGLMEAPSGEDDTTRLRPVIRAENPSGESLTYLYGSNLYVGEDVFEAGSLSWLWQLYDRFLSVYTEEVLKISPVGYSSLCMDEGQGFGFDGEVFRKTVFEYGRERLNVQFVSQKFTVSPGQPIVIPIHCVVP
ncbi:MAG TPA: hypothetical protein IAB22_10955 [Candidatus Merdivicinus intestinavium]|nr:hypothetical protein [Candidatus Merdivicinus intestinavium]